MDNIPLLAKKVEGIAHTKQKHSLFDLFNFSVSDTPWAFFVPEHSDKLKLQCWHNNKPNQQYDGQIKEYFLLKRPKK